MRATARLTRVAVNSVVATLREAGPVAATFHDRHVRRVSPKRVELDESWNFVGAKRKNAPTAKVAEAGDIWLWLAMDPATKLLISYLLGGRNARMAEGLVRDLDGRIETIPHFCTDGYAPCEKAIWNVFGPEAPYNAARLRREARHLRRSRHVLSLASGLDQHISNCTNKPKKTAVPLQHGSEAVVVGLGQIPVRPATVTELVYYDAENGDGRSVNQFDPGCRQTLCG